MPERHRRAPQHALPRTEEEQPAFKPLEFTVTGVAGQFALTVTALDDQRLVVGDVRLLGFYADEEGARSARDQWQGWVEETDIARQAGWDWLYAPRVPSVRALLQVVAQVLAGAQRLAYLEHPVEGLPWRVMVCSFHDRMILGSLTVEGTGWLDQWLRPIDPRLLLAVRDAYGGPADVDPEGGNELFGDDWRWRWG